MGVTAINGVDITSSLALTSSAIKITNTSTGTGPYFPVFVDSTSGDRSARVDSSTFTYNATTDTLTVTASSANTSSWGRYASQSLVVQNATNATFYPTFVDSNPGSPSRESLHSDGNLTFNPSTNEFRAGPINQGTTSNFTYTSNADLTINSSLTQSMYWVASLTTTRRLIVSNLTQGRSVRVYIRNTNASARAIQFSGSTATSYSPVNMAVNAGGASVTQQTIAGSSGTMLVWMENIGGFIVGGVM
jgi:hypothetical protein